MSKIDDSEIAESQLYSPHYLKSVTELGDDQPLVTSRDIYSSKGIKLLNAGARVNSALYERLLHHKLIPNLDECLVTEDTFNNRMLVDEASQLMVFDKHLQMMRTNMPNDGLWTGIMSKIPLNPPIAFKLTVMHAKSPELLKRSIYVALVSSTSECRLVCTSAGWFSWRRPHYCMILACCTSIQYCWSAVTG